VPIQSVAIVAAIVPGVPNTANCQFGIIF